MSLISKMRRQDAVYWRRSLIPDRFGQFGFGDGVLIKCRWEDKVTEYLDVAGERRLSSSTVYVDRPMRAGDVLLLANVVPFLDPGQTPETLPEARRIERFEILPNLKNTESLLTAML